MKIPPYGKPLKQLLELGQLPSNSVYLFVGNKSWDKGKTSSISRPDRTLILPPHEAPSNYIWPVNGCDILMIETSPVSTDYIEQIVDVLFANDANKIILISVEYLITVYKKDF